MYRGFTFWCVAIIALFGAAFSLHQSTELPGQEVSAAATADLMGGLCVSDAQAFCGYQTISCSGLVSGCLSTGLGGDVISGGHCNSACWIWGCSAKTCTTN
jgi:hypothetical protein